MQNNHMPYNSNNPLSPQNGMSMGAPTLQKGNSFMGNNSNNNMGGGIVNTGINNPTIQLKRSNTNPHPNENNNNIGSMNGNNNNNNVISMNI